MCYTNHYDSYELRKIASVIFTNMEALDLRHEGLFLNISLRPKARGKMLFKNKPGFRCSCYVKNMDLPLDQIWYIYNSIADCENRIKELKYDSGLKNFCMKGFGPTEASFRFFMVTYNHMGLFRHFTLNDKKSSTLRTHKSY